MNLDKTAFATIVFSVCCSSLTAVEEQKLLMVNYGGSFSKACVDAYYDDFTRDTGIEIEVEDYTGDLAQLVAQVESDTVYWDVIQMDLTEATRACDEGLIIPLEDLELPAAPDGTPADEDFSDAADDLRSECGISNLFFSTMVAFNTESFSEKQPSKIADFFDLTTYPGRRALRRRAEVNLEIALMADGVPPDQVYEVLSERSGWQRAFAKLDTIKSQIVWWETGAQPPQMLADQEVSMAIAWNGRIFNAQVLEKQPFKIMWDGQVFSHSQLTIASGAPHPENAKRFVQYSMRAESLGGIASRIAYTPTRLSALQFITDHIPTGEPMMHHMPTIPEHLENALEFDSLWWVDNGDEIVEYFSSWLARN